VETALAGVGTLQEPESYLGQLFCVRVARQPAGESERTAGVVGAIAVGWARIFVAGVLEQAERPE
jgi:hypothetical protein